MELATGSGKIHLEISVDATLQGLFQQQRDKRTQFACLSCQKQLYLEVPGSSGHCWALPSRVVGIGRKGVMTWMGLSGQAGSDFGVLSFMMNCPKE